MKLRPDQIGLARMWRNSGIAWATIGDRLGVTAKTVRWALDPDFAQEIIERRRSDRQRARGGPAKEQVHAGAPFRPTEEEFRAARRLIPPDTRDLTQVICGDPLPTRSALDRMRAEGRLP